MAGKKMWDVYLVGEGCGCYASSYSRSFIGTTSAISEKQAINNVRFREKVVLPEPIGDYLDGGFVCFKLVAEVAQQGGNK